jgi:GR25 family glycosyltransferase involved in LPS biosynthesis
MRLTDAFERVVVLNLPYKTDRRERLARHLEALDLVDPARLTWQRALAGDWSPPPAWFHAGNGAWGCLQSHLRVVHDAVMDGIESYCVLEDDVVFKANAAAALGRIHRALPPDWGQLHLD